VFLSDASSSVVKEGAEADFTTAFPKPETVKKLGL
jgi:hypothetical protein